MEAGQLEGPGYALSVEYRQGCLVVRQTGMLPNLDEALRVQRRIARACATHRCARLVIDNRKTEAPSAEVLDSMRRWVHGAEFDLVAFVLDSDLLRVGINMESLQSRRTVRAFEDLASAVHWASRTQDVSPVSVRAPARKHA